MAKIKNLDVAGMTIEQIRGLNTKNLSDKALRQAATRLVSAANKRLARLEQTEGWDVSIWSSTHEPGYRFSIKGATDRNKLFAEFERVRTFLSPGMKSHTVRGWKNEVKKMKAVTGGLNVWRDRYFWILFRHFREEPTGFESHTLRDIMMVEYSNGYRDEDSMKERLAELYEQYSSEAAAKEGGAFEGASDEDWGDDYF